MRIHSWEYLFFLVSSASLLISSHLQVLKDKKLKGQLAVREELYGKSAKAAAKAEKVISLLFWIFIGLFYVISLPKDTSFFLIIT